MDYGRKLSASEYENAIVELYSHAPEMPSKSQDRVLRKRELQLMIDYRLGKDFPDEMREKLWCVHQNIDRKRIMLAARNLFSLMPLPHRIKKANKIAEIMVSEYAKVLGRKEAELFFGLKKGEKPILPVDFQK